MKIKSSYILRQIAGEYLIINNSLNDNTEVKVYSLNESAAYIWNKVVQNDSFTEEELVDYIIAEYEVSREEAQTDIKELIKTWIELGFIED